ncbi:Amastin surface glycofamily protein [Leishmania donovani]|uniref:Amastin surface glycofamily protein n=1 Tax=Leishmania donovani TaxID=5661 RepID=A0A504XNV1_LEIDO|nr:Amastin surface glycofamily protein [Leishmania donovani]
MRHAPTPAPAACTADAAASALEQDPAPGSGDTRRDKASPLAAWADSTAERLVVDGADVAAAFAVISIFVYGTAFVLGLIALCCCACLRWVCLALNVAGIATLCIVWASMVVTFNKYEGPAPAACTADAAASALEQDPAPGSGDTRRDKASPLAAWADSTAERLVVDGADVAALSGAAKR